MATNIDENLYSRQLYAIGFDAMKKMADSSVLISGMNGLGVEIAKNTILQGFKSVTLHDITTITNLDLSTNYYVSNKDIGKNKANASFEKLAELNNYVKTQLSTEPLNQELVKNHSILVLVDYDLETQIKWNNFTHKNNIHFISCSTHGLVGQIFCDFGDDFIVTDYDGEQLNTSIIDSIENSNNPLVICHDSRPHNLTTGDYVKFTDVIGMSELNDIPAIEIQYVSRTSFKLVLDTTQFSKYISGGELTQVKLPRTLKFKSLAESIDSPEFIMTDFADFEKPNKLHALHRSLNNTSTLAQFQEASKKYYDVAEELVERFYLTQSGKLVPINSIIGGTVAQEILKACSGRFTPIYQWLYFDALDCLPKNYRELLRGQNNTRYDAQIQVFGNDFQNKLLDMKYFIVGSGAIGCELLKNFAMIGLGAGKQGKIYITDMDTIEKSNLNRQFLFRNKDIGKSKSETAVNAIKLMNPNVNIISYLDKVGPETENIYNKQFFDELDGVANALDNVSARLYMDRRCVIFKKSLLESGTLGTKANVQVIVPHLTESYSSSRDPPEANIPICTIKTFPSQAVHCIQWAREQFEDLFNQKPKHALEYLQDPDKVKKMSPSEALPFIENIKFVFGNVPTDFTDCIKFAYEQWMQNYNFQIAFLLDKFPIDSVTTTKSLFWSGDKKCPIVLNFDVHNSYHLDYIVVLSSLWANIFGIKHGSKNDIITMLLTIKLSVIPQSNTNNKISLNDEEEKKRLEELTNSINIEQMVKTLPGPDKFNNVIIKLEEFEKDNDANFHIDFVSCASNMRCLNYGIKTETRHVIKGIAGKIIPALATTTSVVAGLVTLELYKLAQGFNEVAQYKNTFLNLALPYFGFSEPIKATVTTNGDKTFTMWDTFMIEGDMTVQKFLDTFKEVYNLDVDTIMYGNFTVYGLILNIKKINMRKQMYIKDIIESELKIKIQDKYIVLMICTGTDDDENDTELPEVLYMIK